MPKRVDIAAQKRLIAQAAVVTIGKSGLDQARLRDVARAANLTTGAVTHYFDGKDAVLEAALDEVVQRIFARQDAARSTEGMQDDDGLIERALEHLPLDDDRVREWRVWLAFWGRAIGDERLRSRHRRYYAEIARRLAAFLPKLKRPGALLPVGQADLYADALIAALDGIGLRATLESELWPAERQRRTLEALLRPLLAAYAASL